ncbi:MAG: hypothetical protein DKM50_10900 [Candidatus Margulisiibacteriota bacterium]|nr:MAG: hypothetical protein A2X43_07710 [Candidatus Margulisbacteria bacterium GWD2_39_127]OGI08804.1 MAG: hypothetical protein A2X41_05090 [Candidatus Margulisbacteria bacterium GWE2_39_32]PZM78635.1 MAG: hypothetical protein DKM50_10900 [Candidatus Margulisiibacteriota bacterium]HAR61976.1 hypothetical protein [Candidatus Margulisiibacteriota bacterium]HCT85030.1 hypothetical protein [Candidatus Margulisiibacteriota bacterium]
MSRSMLVPKNDNKGFILPLTLLIVGIISIIGMSLWYLNYYSSKAASLNNDELIASFAIDSAIARLKYTINNNNPQELDISETFPSANFGRPVMYTAHIKPVERGLPCERTISLNIFFIEKAGPQLIKRVLVKGQVVTSLSPHQFQYALHAGTINSLDYNISSLNIRGNMFCKNPLIFKNNPPEVIIGEVLSMKEITATNAPSSSKQSYASIKVDEPSWKLFDPLYTTTLTGDQELKDIDFNNLGPLVKINGDLTLKGKQISVYGHGTIIVTGRVHINGDLITSQTNHTNSIALMSLQDIIIGENSHIIHAMLYSANDITWSHPHAYQLVGCAVASNNITIAEGSKLTIRYDNRFYTPVNCYNENNSDLFMPVPFVPMVYSIR